ncbi:MAG: carboxypeptidase regulatory-like domain-containing protein [Minicystis sp.]
MTVKIEQGIACNPGHRAVMLNGATVAGFDTVGDCACSSPHATVDLGTVSAGAYTAGGLNAISIHSSTCEGLSRSGALGNSFARITVTYTAPSVVTCSGPSDQCHEVAGCNPSNGQCVTPVKANGSACNDGNACTQGDSCQGGACAGGAAITCSASDPCHVAGACDPATGACSNPAATNGVACSDGNACTQGDTCQGGVCAAGAPFACAALDACHVVGTCDPVTGACNNPVVVNGTTCSDGNACTQGDTCQNGVCSGGVSCPPSDACHVAGVCNLATGTCSNPAAPDGAACIHPDACTHGGTCQSGVCAGAVAVTCSAPDACHMGMCDPVSGACVSQAAAYGTPCNDDGNPCNGAEICNGAGQCAATIPPNLDDGDPCTLDSCDPVQGIAHAACAPIDPTVATTVFDSTAFLYSGPNAAQIGVAPGAITIARAGAIHGRVLTASGAPIAGASATVLHHPEYGSTVTSGDGVFNLAVNGGGPLTVNVAATGLLPAQRTLEVPWGDYAPAGDIALVPFDPVANPVDLASPEAFQIAQGSVSTDADGSRRATLLFAAGTTATMTLPGGATASLEGGIHVRATEYTVGPNGAKAMPGTLPPTSAYTYAAELSIDEAVAVGATKVEFSQPVILYVDNFLGFPGGLDVPTGFYDREAAAWKAAPSGRTLAVVALTGGLAQLDIDGDGAADSANALAALGITPAEQAEIAVFASAGDTLWRVPIQHFSPWDCNWPFGPPPGACAPFDALCAAGGPGTNPTGSAPKDDPCVQPGSIIECDNQILGERVPVAGTPFELDYRSDRVPGRTTARALDIPLSGGTLPPGLKRIDLTVDVAGRSLTDAVICPCALNQVYPFVWDGKDAFGRIMRGAQPVTVTIGYIYDGDYQKTASFGSPGYGSLIVGSTTRGEIGLLKIWKGTLSPWDQKPEGLGGFSLSPHHVYVPIGKTLYLGNGQRRHADAAEPVIRTIAGGNVAEFSGDGGLATAAHLSLVRGITVAPDGSIYMADVGVGRIRKVDPNGTITTVAGHWQWEPTGGDEGPATSSALLGAVDVKLGPDGSFYMADAVYHRVRKVSPNGMMSTLAGTGVAGFSGDGGPALSAMLDVPKRLAVAPDGTIYVADNSDRVRRIGTDGIIRTVAGGGISVAEGVAATSAAIYDLKDIALGPDGSLYLGCKMTISDVSSRIRRVGLDGIITTIAGGPSWAAGGDIGADVQAASVAHVGDIGALTVSSDGTVYFGELEWGANKIRIRKVTPDGILSTVSGGPPSVFLGEAGPAAAATFSDISGISMAPDGSLYATVNTRRIVRISPIMPGLSVNNPLILSEDGAELYAFNPEGRHLQTVDVQTGAVRYAFAYDPAGKLESVTDIDGQSTTIQYDAQGHPSAIIAPHGQLTALAVDGNGYLASVTDPAGGATHFTYGNGGLLASMTDAKGQTHSFAYDALGRLTHDQDPAGVPPRAARG